MRLTVVSHQNWTERALQQQQLGIAEVLPKHLQELGGGGLVNHPSVCGKLHRHRGGHTRRALPFLQRRQHLGQSRTHCEDAGLRRVDDSGEGRNAEHAQVGHREGATLELLRLQLAFAGPASQVLHRLSDGRHSASVGSRHDGRDESVGCGNRHRDVHLALAALHRSSGGIPASIGPGHVPQCERGALDDQVVDGHRHVQLLLQLLAEK
mmetsp:Transcript_23496/g.32211  ORF Transcript_23496/g.32211 Transcript_23496/m.32211 type:complete len:209 (-) Transcript_23496:937-1563(-)